MLKRTVLKLQPEHVHMKENDEDFLLDRTKKLLKQEMESSEDFEEDDRKPEMKRKRNELDKKAEQESTSKIPFTFDPHEIEFLAENRKSMSNDEMKEFLKKDSEVHEKLEEIDEWEGFSRWEERFIVKNASAKSPGEIAEQMDRQEEEVELKMQMLGLKIDEDVDKV